MTPMGRWRMVQRFLAGQRVADVAGQMQVSRQTVYKWVRRYRSEGRQGLADRSSRPHQMPRRTPRHLEDRIVKVRERYRWGADRIGLQLGVPASTVQRVLDRRRCPKLSMIDRPSGEVVRRYERAAPSPQGRLRDPPTTVSRRTPASDDDPTASRNDATCASPGLETVAHPSADRVARHAAAEWRVALNVWRVGAKITELHARAAPTVPHDARRRSDAQRTPGPHPGARVYRSSSPEPPS